MKIKAWVARDENDKVYLFYREKPVKKEWGFWDSMSTDYIDIPEEKLPEGINPRWEDEEPIELDITITRASKEI